MMLVYGSELDVGTLKTEQFVAKSMMVGLVM